MDDPHSRVPRSTAGALARIDERLLEVVVGLLLFAVSMVMVPGYPYARARRRRLRLFTGLASGLLPTAIVASLALLVFAVFLGSSACGSSSTRRASAAPPELQARWAGARPPDLRPPLLPDPRMGDTPRWLSLEGGGDEVLRLPVTGVLARSRAAGSALLETGLNPRFCRTPADVGQIYPGAPPELTSDDPLLDGLAACGVALGDLAAAAVSHLHVDHVGGLPHLAGGPPVFVQGRELAFAMQRGTPRKAYWRPDYSDPAIDWHGLDGDQEIVPGIEAASTPGHTPGHMSYRVRMEDSGTWLFAVDAIDLQEGIDTGVPIGASVDPADAPLRRCAAGRTSDWQRWRPPRARG